MSKKLSHKNNLNLTADNLLKWYPFIRTGSLLEIGYHSVSLTELYCHNLSNVTSLVANNEDAGVFAQRPKIFKNHNIVVGKFSEFISEQKYDYISLIGLSYYSDLFINSKKTKIFLSKINNILKRNGVLIISGANNNNPDNLTDLNKKNDNNGIENRVMSHQVVKKSMANKEKIEEFLYAANYKQIDWYYPYPDYKIPKMVLSSQMNLEYLSNKVGIPLEITENDISTKKQFRDFPLSASNIHVLFNSFLLIARKSDIGLKRFVLHYIGANKNRKPHYRANICIYKNEGEKIFAKIADNKKAIDFVKIVDTRDRLAKKYLNPHATVVDGELNNNIIKYPYLPYQTLQDLIKHSIKGGSSDYGSHYIEEYLTFLNKLPRTEGMAYEFFQHLNIQNKKNVHFNCLSFGPLDLVPKNILINKNKWYIIDNEWTYDFPVPRDYIVFRGILTLLNELQDIIKNNISLNNPVVLFGGYCTNKLYLPYDWLHFINSFTIPVEQLQYWNWLFQKNILISTKLGSTRLKRNPRKIYALNSSAYGFIALKNKMCRILLIIKKKLEYFF